MTLEFHTFDVFTTTPYAGNPLAIVMGAGGLTGAQMQTIAREFNLSETIFVMPPRDPAHTARVRIFFPTDEIPFAGHPTIGCAIHLAQAAHSGDFSTVITLEEEAGLVPVTVTRKGRDIRAELTAPVIPFEVPVTLATAEVAAALGLVPGDIGPFAPGVFEGGPRFAFVPVRSLAALGNARPAEPHWSHLVAQAGVHSAYVYAPGDGCDFRARMFSPTAGIGEDPATGSASAILAAHLLRHGALADGTTTLALRQGVEMGRPSDLTLTIDCANQTLTAVRLAGSAVRISTGQVQALPAG